MSMPGLLHALMLDGAGRARPVAWADVEAWTPDQGLLWLDLDYHTPEVMTWLMTASKIDPVTISALTDSDPRPRAAVHGENLLLVLRGINNNAGAEPEDMISVRTWIEPRRIVMLRHRQSTTVQSLVADLERGAGPRTAADFTLLLVERMVEHVVARVDVLGDDVAACEDRALAGDHSDLRAALADHRRRAIGLRRFLAPQREAMTRLNSIAVPWLDAQHRSRINEVTEDMLRAIEELDAARDRAAVTQEELSSRVAEVANQRLYLLSIITAFFLPLGFVCSLLGVNLAGMPGTHTSWAFWALCGVFAVAALVQLWFFRKRGWLGKR
jgi:zinc transporter